MLMNFRCDIIQVNIYPNPGGTFIYQDLYDDLGYEYS